MGKPDPWVCDWCKVHYPVPSMARDCEQAHLEDDDA